MTNRTGGDSVARALAPSPARLGPPGQSRPLRPAPPSPLPAPTPARLGSARATVSRTRATSEHPRPKQAPANAPNYRANWAVCAWARGMVRGALHATPHPSRRPQAPRDAPPSTDQPEPTLARGRETRVGACNRPRNQRSASSDGAPGSTSSIAGVSAVKSSVASGFASRGDRSPAARSGARFRRLRNTALSLMKLPGGCCSPGSCRTAPPRCCWA